EERGGRAVDHRPSRFVLLTEDSDELALEERLDDSTRVHASDVVDFRSSDGLPIRHDSQRLQLGATQAYGTLGKEFANVRGISRVGAKGVTFGHFYQADAAILRLLDDDFDQFLNASFVHPSSSRDLSG